MITQESVREVIETARIEDVVRDYVSLKRSGNNLTGLCPFHNEKTPSFNVNPARNIYKCFGCGVGGDPVNFLMELEQLSFPDAIRRLAAKYNLKLEERELSPEVRQEQQERDSLLIVNDFARRYFSEQLHGTDEGRSVGLSYFKSRGFLRETMDTFGLGYAPAARDGLLRAATAAGFAPEQLTKLGLVRNGRDFFRDRVMFTIHNLSGKPIAFAGRILRKDAKAPKYINSPETEVYHKSDVLFGMHQARQHVRKLDNLLVVEGYTDVISLHQGGIRNVVATSGTSLTPGQAKLMRRFSENVTLLYDGDRAGVKAALRGVDVLLAGGLNVRVVILPDGHDPDSYLRQVGSTALETYLNEQRKDFLFFKANLLLEEAGEEDVAARTAAIRDIGATLALIEDPLKRAGYIQQFSTRLRMGEELLVNLVNTAVADRRSLARREREREARGREARGREVRGRGSRGKETTGGGANDDDGWAGLVEPGWADNPDAFPAGPPPTDPSPAGSPAAPEPLGGDGFQERHLAELLVRFGHQTYDAESATSVAAFLLANVADLLDILDHPLYRRITDLAGGYLSDHGSGPPPDWYRNHAEAEVRQFANDATTTGLTMSENWQKKYGLYLSQKPPEENYALAAETFVVNFRLRKLNRKMDEVRTTIKTLIAEGDEAKLLRYLKLLDRLNRMLAETSARVGNVVIR